MRLVVSKTMPRPRSTYTSRVQQGPSREQADLPIWIKPQLATLVTEAPDGSGWLHEIKLDGYRMHARLDAGRVQILTRRGNENGKIAEEIGLDDGVAALQQLGILKTA